MGGSYSRLDVAKLCTGWKACATGGCLCGWEDCSGGGGIQGWKRVLKEGQGGGGRRTGGAWASSSSPVRAEGGAAWTEPEKCTAEGS